MIGRSGSDAYGWARGKYYAVAPYAEDGVISRCGKVPATIYPISAHRRAHETRQPFFTAKFGEQLAPRMKENGCRFAVFVHRRSAGGMVSPYGGCDIALRGILHGFCTMYPMFCCLASCGGIHASPGWQRCGREVRDPRHDRGRRGHTAVHHGMQKGKLIILTFAQTPRPMVRCEALLQHGRF